MPKYRELVTAVITPEVQDLLREAAWRPPSRPSPRPGVSREAKVFATGVSTIDADSATALVAGSFTDTYPDAKGRPSPTSRRRSASRCSLVKTDGTWLVDDFTPGDGRPRPVNAQLVRPARRRPRRLRGRDPGGLEGRDRRPRPDRPHGSAVYNQAAEVLLDPTAPGGVRRRAGAPPSRGRAEAAAAGTEARGRRPPATAAADAATGPGRRPARRRAAVAGPGLAAGRRWRCSPRVGRGRLRLAWSRRGRRTPRSRSPPGPRRAPPSGRSGRSCPTTTAHLDEDQKAAESYMTSGYRTKYDQLFEVIKQNAPRTQTRGHRRRSSARASSARARTASRCCCSSTGRPPTSRPPSPGRLQGPGHGADGEGRRRLARRLPDHQRRNGCTDRGVGARPGPAPRRGRLTSAPRRFIIVGNVSPVRRSPVLWRALSSGIVARCACPQMRIACPVADLVVGRRHPKSDTRRRTPLGRAHHHW